MKTTIFVLLASALIPVCPTLLRAADTPPARHSPEELRELSAVEQFLELSNAQLDQLQEVIARIRAMTPAQRSQLRQEVLQYRRLPNAQRERLRQGWEERHPGMGTGWGHMPAGIRDAWREMIQQATPEQHAAIQAKLQPLSPEERSAYRLRLVEEFLKTKAIKP